LCNFFFTFISRINIYSTYVCYSCICTSVSMIYMGITNIGIHNQIFNPSICRITIRIRIIYSNINWYTIKLKCSSTSTLLLLFFFLRYQSVRYSYQKQKSKNKFFHSFLFRIYSFNNKYDFLCSRFNIFLIICILSKLFPIF